MSENQSSEVFQKTKKTSVLSWIIAIIYFVFICVPVALFIYVSVNLFFGIRKICILIKKTIKNEKAQFEPKSFEGLP